MSAISQTAWLPYLRPSVATWPTAKASSPGRLNVPDLSVPAKDPRLFPSHNAIDRLAALRDNWDGQGSQRPSSDAIERAREILEEAYRLTRRTVGWQAPHVSATEDGEVAFEWWNGPKKLTIYVGSRRSTFLKSWGPHIVDEMVDGVLTRNWDPALWGWLFK